MIYKGIGHTFKEHVKKGCAHYANKEKRPVWSCHTNTEAMEEVVGAVGVGRYGANLPTLFPMKATRAIYSSVDGQFKLRLMQKGIKRKLESYEMVIPQ